MSRGHHISWIIRTGNSGEIQEKVSRYFERVVKHSLETSREPLRIDGSVQNKEEVSKQVVYYLTKKADELSSLDPEEFDAERMRFLVSLIVDNSADLRKYLPYEDLNIHLFNLIRWYEASGNPARAVDINRTLAEDFFGKGNSQVRDKNYQEAELFFRLSEDGYSNALRLLSHFIDPKSTKDFKKKIAEASLYNKICSLHNSNGKWINLRIKLLESVFRLRWDIGFPLFYFILYHVVYLILLVLSWRLYGEMNFTQYFRTEFGVCLGFYMSLTGMFIAYFLAVRRKE